MRPGVFCASIVKQESWELLSVGETLIESLLIFFTWLIFWNCEVASENMSFPVAFPHARGSDWRASM